MKPRVVGSQHDFDVFWIIVQLVAVNVMDGFSCLKRPTNFPFGDHYVQTPASMCAVGRAGGKDKVAIDRKRQA